MSAGCGNINATRVPRPSWLEMSTDPLCKSMMLLTMLSPNPTPPERRVRAREHEAQPLVGNLFAFLVLGKKFQYFDIFLAGAPAACRVDQLAARDREQPGLRRARDATARPLGKRRGESLGQRVLGPRDVARARGEEGDELAVAAPRHLLRGLRYIAQIGRTSTEPRSTAGQRAAQASAASRSGASIR